MSAPVNTFASVLSNFCASKPDVALECWRAERALRRNDDLCLRVHGTQMNHTRPAELLIALPHDCRVCGSGILRVSMPDNLCIIFPLFTLNGFIQASRFDLVLAVLPECRRQSS